MILMKVLWVCMTATTDSEIEDVGRGVEMVVVGAIVGGGGVI